MNVKEIFNKVSWENVRNSFIHYYPELKSAIELHKEAFDEIRNIHIIPIGHRYKVGVSSYSDDWDTVYDVSLYDDEEEGNDIYSLTGFSWGEIAGYELHEMSYKFSYVDIVAHILWEMTFYGFSSEEYNDAISKMGATSQVIEIIRNCVRGCGLQKLKILRKE